jgi:hypothetical protein
MSRHDSGRGRNSDQSDPACGATFRSACHHEGLGDARENRGVLPPRRPPAICRMKTYGERLRILLTSWFMSVHSSLNPQLTLRKRVCFSVGRFIVIAHENALEWIRPASGCSDLGLSPPVSRDPFTILNWHLVDGFDGDGLPNPGDANVA